jgi:hypothetical protein
MACARCGGLLVIGVWDSLVDNVRESASRK